MAIGVDVHCFYQRGVNWAQVTNVNYVWTKVSDGTRAYTYTDTSGKVWRPDTMVAGAKSRGIPVGGYHYAQPGDPRAQADLLINQVERLGAIGVLPALDLESPFHADSVARAFGEAFCNRVRERGYRPVAYMSDSFARNLKPADWAAQPVLWIARYGSKPAFTRYDIHQYSSSGTLPGSAGAVDYNESYNSSHLNNGSNAAPAMREDDDMQADERRALFQLVEQTTGTRDLDKYPGWPRVNPGSITKATLVDFVRQSYEDLQKLKEQTANVAAPQIDYDKLAAAIPAELAEDIAERVAQKIAARIQQ